LRYTPGKVLSGETADVFVSQKRASGKPLLTWKPRRAPPPISRAQKLKQTNKKHAILTKNVLTEHHVKAEPLRNKMRFRTQNGTESNGTSTCKDTGEAAHRDARAHVSKSQMPQLTRQAP